MWALPALDIKAPGDWITMLSSYTPEENVWAPGVSQQNDPMSADPVRYIDSMNTWLAHSKNILDRNATIQDLKDVYSRMKNELDKADEENDR